MFTCQLGHISREPGHCPWKNQSGDICGSTLKTLQDRLKQLVSDCHSMRLVLMVCGRPGSGKVRLVEEACNTLDEGYIYFNLPHCVLDDIVIKDPTAIVALDFTGAVSKTMVEFVKVWLRDDRPPGVVLISENGSDVPPEIRKFVWTAVTVDPTE